MALDAIKIGQVLDNLISNAVKFSPRNAEVIVSLDSTPDGVLVSVRDAGPGIPQHEMTKLFKPFSRITTRATDGEKSTGLGLSIAQRIVTAHGGSIWAESEEGVGTVFRFLLPPNSVRSKS